MAASPPPFALVAESHQREVIQMSGNRRNTLSWAALVFGGLSVLLGFWQWWSESQARQDPMLSGEVPGTWLEQWAITTHLVPTLVLLVAVVLAWRWPLVGAVVFLGYVAMAAIVMAPEWVYLLFAIPHATAGGLFLADWWLSRKPATASS